MSDAYATIKLAAKHSKLILVRNQHLATGNINSIFMEFELRTGDWANCKKLTAVFNDEYSRNLNDALRCDIPAEVLAIPGEFSVNLYGTAGDVRLSTNKVNFLVMEGGSSEKIPDSGGTIPSEGAAAPKLTSVTMLASGWVGSSSPYSQVISCSGVSANSKVDLQPTPEQVASLQDAEISLMAVNDNGKVAVYALGDKPTVDYNMQALITEVDAI